MSAATSAATSAAMGAAASCGGPRRWPAAWAARAALWAMCLFLCSCVARGGGGHDRPRAIVLGFDGLDHEVTRSLMDAGRLPNFARLARGGGFSPLKTTIPPQSPVAWSSFITGLDPGGHGIFDFIHRDPRTLAPYFSTTRTEPPRWTIPLGPWRLPLRGGSVTLLRDGEPFWARLERAGIRTTINRMPANFPPSGLATHELSGMGTPDLLGTYGTFSFYTSAPWAFAGRTIAGGTVTRVRVAGHAVRATLHGPENPYRRDGQTLTQDFTVHVDPEEAVARIVIGDEERVLKVGEWSDWVPVSFPLMPLQQLRGACRLYLKQVRPDFELYVSPLNLDPLAPAMSISTPASYAAALAKATGRFYTQGIPEDTKAYSAGVFTADEFLAQARLTAGENLRQYERALDTFSSSDSTQDFLFHYFGHVDQVSHMMWRARDPQHPAYDAATDARYAHVIDDLYVQLDAIVGRTLDRMAPGTLLIVMSDHGFTSWRRAFHLNSWLEQQGYLTVRDPSRRKETMFANVDWSRTRAYGLGLNGLYLNVQGREQQGIVDPAAREALAAEIAAKLLAAIDPATGQPAVTRVFRREEAYAQVARPDLAPDLIVGYAKGTRGSNESALGEVPAEALTDNREPWSGDHCMDPESVPGVLLTSRPLRTRPASLQDLTHALLTELGVAR